MRRLPGWAILFLVVQVAVPAWQLRGPRPARFGWQMYAGAALAPKVTVINRDGSTSVAQVDQYIVRLRDDLDLVRYLPPAICARTGAVAIRYLAAPGQHPVEIACHH